MTVKTFAQPSLAVAFFASAGGAAFLTAALDMRAALCELDEGNDDPDATDAKERFDHLTELLAEAGVEVIIAPGGPAQEIVRPDKVIEIADPALTARDIHLTDEAGADTDVVIARQVSATPEHAERVLAAVEGDMDGRSEWRWVRFQNGDLMLGVFPHGDTYLGTEADPRRP